MRAADLRFTTDEAEVFLNEVMGLALEPTLVAALEARTEGWAAGAAGGGARVPARHLRAVVQLTGGLCNALTGRRDGQPMLATLERENLFVVPLDDERRWYRYHHLFADALRARLVARHTDRVGELHAAASRWLAENGLLADAVRHAIRSGDHEHTADLVELSLADLRRRRQDRTLRRTGSSRCPRTS